MDEALDTQGALSDNRGNGLKHLMKAVLFMALIAVAVAMLSPVFSISVQGNANDDSVAGMYLQPEKTVQIAAFGPSTTNAAISSMDLYEGFGYCAYNCATALQSFEASYWLMQEMIRMHGDELKVALVDPSMLVLGAGEQTRKAHDERILVNMKYSTVRIMASIDMWRLYSDGDFLTSLVPLVRYHSRWDELSAEDFAPNTVEKRVGYTHGQFIRYLCNAETKEGAAVSSNANAKITDKREKGEGELRSMWNANDAAYFDKFFRLCREHGIDIVLFQTPHVEWGDDQHDSIQLLADDYGIPFIDMSTQSAMDELGINYAMDFVDGKHSNIHGSHKITAHLGKFISDNYELDDKRGDSRYAFMEEDAVRYGEAMEDSQLLLTDHVEEYLRRIDRDRYTVFIAAKGNAGKSLSDEARKACRELGLVNLSKLADGEHYVGILDGGSVALDEASEKKGTALCTFNDGLLKLSKTKMQPGASFKNSVELASSNNAGTVVIGGAQKAENKVGLNFIVFNKQIAYGNVKNTMVDTSCFDTSVGSKRTSDIPTPQQGTGGSPSI